MSNKAKDNALLLLSGWTILLSSSLLFLVQPLISKIFLPIFGGSPEVWNTAMVFFQVSLLGGYYYAHASQKLSPKAEIALYAVLLAAALCALPIGLPGSWTPDWRDHVSLNLLFGLVLAAGLPFFVVSTASPLIQKWFSYSSHTSAKDPYFLYAISNVGSLAALLSYPFLVEPNFTVHTQLTAWSGVFLAFAVSIFTLRLLTNVPPRSAGVIAAALPPIETKAKLQWLILAAIPSSLSLGVTQHISTDVAAFPLLWVVPLALYLFSFIVAFSEIGKLTATVCRKIFPFAVLLPVILIATEQHGFVGSKVCLHLLAFSVIAVCAHSRLAQSRPDSAHLTQFYLFLSIGGALGGIFNSLVAPILFNSVLEYMIAISLACIFVWPGPRGFKTEGKGWRDYLPGKDDLFAAVLAIALLICAGPLSYALDWDWELGNLSFYQLMEIIPVSIVCLLTARNQKRFTLMVTLLMFFPQLGLLTERKTIWAERTFFGVLRIQERPSRFGKWTQLWHGSTLHGMQFSTEPLSTQPVTYYTQKSPISRVLTSEHMIKQDRDVAIIGLGTGTSAAFGRPGWTMTYFEIDPVIKEIASDRKYFSYLWNSRAKIRIGIGDARIKMAEVPDASFDVIVTDAFSSDAVPIHLMTKEAVELYLSKLRENGYVIFHITNRHLQLAPAVSAIVRDLSLTALFCSDAKITAEEDSQGRYASDWVIAARKKSDLDALGIAEDACQPLAPTNRVAWTDDYSDVISVMK